MTLVSFCHLPLNSHKTGHLVLLSSDTVCLYSGFLIYLFFSFWLCILFYSLVPIENGTFKKILLLLLFLLYNIVLVLPYINMNPPRVYTCSPSWTPLPSPSPYHPSGSSQCTSPKHPVSCIEPRLAIHFLYDIIHVLMPFSQIIPPSPSPTTLPVSSLWVIPVHQPQASCILYQT